MKISKKCLLIPVLGFALSANAESNSEAQAKIALCQMLGVAGEVGVELAVTNKTWSEAKGLEMQNKKLDNYAEALKIEEVRRSILAYQKNVYDETKKLYMSSDKDDKTLIWMALIDGAVRKKSYNSCMAD